ncbi:MAG: DUF2059 domain-containing protein [Acidobacteriaceae bacterium]
MKRWIGILTGALIMVLALAPLQARADEASKEAKVKQLFAVMRMDSNLDGMLQAMRQHIQMTAQNGEGNQPMTPARKAIEQKFINNAQQVMNQSFGWPQLEPAYVKLYMNTYTESQLDGMLAFYKSPAGQAMLNHASQVRDGVMQIVHSRMGEFASRMQALQQQYTQQMGH